MSNTMVESCRWWPLGLALAGVAVLSAFGPALDARQTPVFRASTELVVVEVQVVDGAGQPAGGLAPEMFDVRIDGRRRTVMVADRMRYASDGATSRPDTPAAGPAARNTWPVSEGTPGRTFVVAVDTLTLSAGDGARVVAAVGRFADQLSSNDSLGLVALPRGIALRPTENRVPFRQALAKVSGLQGMRSNPFHLTAAEVIDLNAEIDQMASSSQITVAGRGGRAVVTTPQDVLRQVQARECRGTNDSTCLAELMLEAEAQARFTEETVEESIQGLARLLTLLESYPGRKTVVLVSGGMPVSDRAGSWNRDGSEVRALGRAAAMASASVYAVHVDVGYRNIYSAETRLSRPASSLSREQDVQQRLLADFAYASGGTLFWAPTDVGEKGLARVLTETETFYSLGVVPEARDLDGRPHELRVSVKQPNLDVRSARFVVLRRKNG